MNQRDVDKLLTIYEDFCDREEFIHGSRRSIEDFADEAAKTDREYKAIILILEEEFMGNSDRDSNGYSKPSRYSNDRGRNHRGRNSSRNKSKTSGFVRNKGNNKERKSDVEEHTKTRKYKYVKQADFKLRNHTFIHSERLLSVFDHDDSQIIVLALKGRDDDLTEAAIASMKMAMGIDGGIRMGAVDSPDIKFIETINKASFSSSITTYEVLREYIDGLSTVSYPGVYYATKGVSDIFKDSIETNKHYNETYGVIINFGDHSYGKEIEDNISLFMSRVSIPADSEVRKLIESYGPTTHIMTSDYLFKLHYNKENKEIYVEHVLTKNAV